jgi:pyruvate,orthophosphate dikinase
MTSTTSAKPHTYVYDFADGDRSQQDLLGGKGANLAEMTRMGLPVPPGFTITTEACRYFLEHGHGPEGLRTEIARNVQRLEEEMGRRLGDPEDPLLVSVRSGARFSMPGMMETVLNIGLNDASVAGLAAHAHDDHFAWDSYRRLIQMFGKTVLGLPGDDFEHALEQMKESAGVKTDVELPVDALRRLVDVYKAIVREETGHEFPQDPSQQLDLAIRSVFHSWNTDRARLYRRQERIPHTLGTAVNVQVMAFGNAGPGSGTGVAFTRDPGSGARGVYGDYLADAQGEDVVAGIRNASPLQELEKSDPKSYNELMDIMHKLEMHYRDLCDIEFTVERGKLWMLQTRVGKRTAGAAFRIAVQLVDEGVISMDEALMRVNGAQLGQLMFPRFATGETHDLIATGMNASPGAAVGRVVFDSSTAVKWAATGENVILVRRETNPDDLEGMIAAAGILTSRGGKTSHAAVVARGMGKTAVCGAESLDVDTRGRQMITSAGETVKEGEVVSIDGTSGQVFLGEVPVVPSAVVTYFESGLDVALAQADEATAELIRAVDRIMAHADQQRRLRVRANADTPADAVRARHMGAEGIGLLRTEHMFLGERKTHVERLILAEGENDRREALEALLPLQRKDFIRILEAMDGLPVTIRLIDPPLHEFLPERTELAVRVAVAESTGSTSRTRCWDCAAFALASSCPGCSPCRCGPSRRPPASGSAWAGIRARRSWCRWWDRSRSWNS